MQTIAPKFSGRFNKGVDYVGDVVQFEREMALDVAALSHGSSVVSQLADLTTACQTGPARYD